MAEVTSIAKDASVDIVIRRCLANISERVGEVITLEDGRLSDFLPGLRACYKGLFKAQLVSGNPGQEIPAQFVEVAEALKLEVTVNMVLCVLIDAGIIDEESLG